MNEYLTLGRAVSKLTLEERRELLEKFKSPSAISKDPLYEEDNGGANILETDYEKQSWLKRLFYKIQGLIKGKPPKQLFDERQMAQIGKKINTLAPGLYDYRSDLLLPALYKRLIELKDAARFFYRVLDRSINQDKGAFYAFLASLELGTIHQRLGELTSPEYLADRNPDAGEGDLRQLAINNLNEGLRMISDAEKKRMYHNVRALSCLKALASFLFDRLIMNFVPGKTGPHNKEPLCTGNIIKEPLMILLDVLFSLKEPPPMVLFEALFVFTFQDRRNGLNPNAAVEMQRLLSQAENSLEKIRTFNRQVPLLLILRCITGNIDLEPKSIGGGEDWFVIYQDYWKEQIEERFYQYLRKRRYEDLIKTFNSFLEGTPLSLLENAESFQNIEGFPIPNVYSLACLKTFFRMAFINEMNQYLDAILVEGLFFQKDVKELFTKSYQDIFKVQDAIQQLEGKIAPDGEYGKPYFTVARELSLHTVKQHRAQNALSDAAEEARRILSDTRKAVLNMINILEKIINGKADSLVNLSYVSDRMPVFLRGLAAVLGRLRLLIKLLDNVSAIEDGV